MTNPDGHAPVGSRGLSLRALGNSVAVLSAHPDPRVARGNLIALVLTWNTPFYPLYLRWVAGAEAFPVGLLTLCVLPCYVLVPMLARRRPMAARLLLTSAALADTVFCVWVLGQSSGAELFLLPCVLLPGLIFGPGDTRLVLGLVALPFVAYYGMHSHYPEPPHVWSPAASAAILALNAGSVGGLVALFALLVARSPAQ